MKYYLIVGEDNWADLIPVELLSMQQSAKVRLLSDCGDKCKGDIIDADQNDVYFQDHVGIYRTVSMSNAQEETK